MFNLLSRRAAIQSQQNLPRQTKLSAFIRKIQNRWADVMSRQDRKLTINQRKVFLCLFILAMSLLSGYWIYQGIFPGKNLTLPGMQHEGITPPTKVALPDSLDMNLLKSYQRWRMFKDSSLDKSKR